MVGRYDRFEAASLDQLRHWARDRCAEQVYSPIVVSQRIMSSSAEGAEAEARRTLAAFSAPHSLGCQQQQQGQQQQFCMPVAMGPPMRTK